MAYMYSVCGTVLHRTLEGLPLVAFDPKSIMVSRCSLKEVNQLRQAYRIDLPLYAIFSSAEVGEKRKMTLMAVQELLNMPQTPT